MKVIRLKVATCFLRKGPEELVSLFYAGLLLIASVTSLLAVSILWKRRDTPSAMPLMCFMLSLAVWSITYTFHWLSDTPETRFFWLASTYFGVVPAPVCIFFFALIYAGKEKWITRSTIALLCVIPVLTLLILLTDPLHHLFFGDEPADASRIFDGGIWFWISTVYIYLVIFVSYFLIARTWYRARGIYRQQALLVLVALSVPLLINIGGFLGFFPLTDIDTTPLMFTLTGVVIIYALFYKKLLDLVPIARDQVMQTMREPFFIVDGHNRIIDLNDAAVRLCETIAPEKHDSIIGAPITGYFPLWQQWKGADEPVGEIELVTSGQEPIQTYEWRVSSVANELGRVQGSLMLLNNITRRKVAAQREFELALERERVKLLQKFIQNTAHEIRTPLTIISLNASRMSKLSDAQQRLAKASEVERQIQRITRLLSISLLMMELEDSEIEINTVTDVEPLLRDIGEEVAARYGDAITLSFESSRPLPAVMANSGYLSEAFRQLLDNACRFSPSRGVVTMRTGASDGQVWVEVADNGSGIPVELQPFVFTMFWRHDEAHSTEGFGIGLSIVKRIVEHHRGEISLVSAAGEGTTIRVTLPAVPSSAPAQSES